MGVALLTGCQDRPYACGLAMALTSGGASLDMIGGTEQDSPELHTQPRLRFVNLRGSQRRVGVVKKVTGLLAYYARLIRYAARSSPPLLHILWNDRFEYFDRTILTMYYRLLGKKVVLTAHNVNRNKRDKNDSVLNRLTLRVQYGLVDHIFVHTRKMKQELIDEFGVGEQAVTVVDHPINDAFPDTLLTSAEAKQRLGLTEREKTLLFFGRLRPYKGLEYLLSAFEELSSRDDSYRLIIAGEPKKGDEAYFANVRERVKGLRASAQVMLRTQFIPDGDVELYLKAADVLVLPYTDIEQSGVLFLGFTFGLPAIVSDVGSFNEVVVDGETGFVCKPGDSDDLARTIGRYFESDLFKNVGQRRREIREQFRSRHSWTAFAATTRHVYEQLLRR